MKQSLAILCLASLAGAQVHAAPASDEVPLSGISMTTAKRLQFEFKIFLYSYELMNAVSTKF